jgi:hypothetical protein
MTSQGRTVLQQWATQIQAEWPNVQKAFNRVAKQRGASIILIIYVLPPVNMYQLGYNARIFVKFHIRDLYWTLSRKLKNRTNVSCTLHDDPSMLMFLTATYNVTIQYWYCWYSATIQRDTIVMNFDNNNGYANAPPSCVVCTLPIMWLKHNICKILIIYDKRLFRV